MKISKNKSGNYTALVYIGKSLEGKDIVKRVTAPTRAEVLMQAAKLKAGREATAETLDECCRAYIDAKTGVLSPSTIRAYNTYYKNHVQKNRIGAVKLKALTNEKLQLWIREMAKTVKPKTVQNVLGLVTAVLDMFYPDFRVRVSKPQPEDPELYTPGTEEIEAFLELIKEDKALYLACLLSAFGTLRRGEVAGLMASDIDRNTCEVTVRRSVVLDGHEWVVKPPKTRKSLRTVRFPAFVIELCPTEGPVVGLTPGAISDRFARAMEKYDGHPFRFHDLRHYSASIMAVIGCSKVTIRQRGGWSSDVAERIYVNAIPKEVDKDTEKLMRYFETRQGIS